MKPKLCVKDLALGYSDILKARKADIAGEKDRTFEGELYFPKVVVSVGQPEKNLYNFKGSAQVQNLAEESNVTLELKNFIHRGSLIKNSGKVHLLIVYTGKDSKIFLN